LVPEPQHLARTGCIKPSAGGALAASRSVFAPAKALIDPQLFDGHNDDGNLEGGAHNLGTTIMAVSFDGGVVLAADTRTSTGSIVVNRAANKLTKLTDNVYCCRSGSAADTQAMAELVSRYMRQYAVDTNTPIVPTKAVANLFHRMCYNYKNQISAGILVGGWDEINGGTVYSIPSGGAMVQAPYAMGGSGSIFLYSFMDEHYKQGLSKDQCLNLLRAAVSHAMARDGSSGGMMRTIVIDRTGTEHNTVPWKSIPYCLEKDPQFGPLLKQNPPLGPSAKDEENQTQTIKY
jgi:20S proteasome subunit beta 1